MNDFNKIYMKVSYPTWSVIMLSICFVIVLPCSLIFTLLTILNNGLSAIGVIFSIIVYFELWFLRFLYYSIFATEAGIKTKNLFGSNKMLLWEEIIEVTRPRWGIPYEFTYVISKNKKKTILMRSMQNYNELIDLIKSKAPHLIRMKDNVYFKRR